jgi:hypothetical protein
MLSLSAVESSLLCRLESGGISRSMLENALEKGMLDSDERSLCDVVESKKSSVKLPWNGVVLEGKCMGIKYNGGLYTQCDGERKGEYCVGCERLKLKGGGILPYGSVECRMSCGIMEYEDPRGRKPICYTKIMKKNNWSREEVEMEASRLDIKLSSCHFEEIVSSRGRPRKESKVVEGIEKKKRGRPRKEKEVVSNETGEDLIASLLCEEKESLPVAVEVDVEAKGNNNMESLELMEKESVSELNVNVRESEIETEDEECEVVVKKFEFGGNEYLRSSENVLYDIESHEAIGVWNEMENKIDELEEEE